jgi:2-polyprenyl-3-methyl-5-hydroxy-6-metoxy-1,4-benzoquinol methylase
MKYQVALTMDVSKIPVGIDLVPIDSLSSKDREHLIDMKICPVCSDELKEVVTLSGLHEKLSFARGYCNECGYFGTKRWFDEEWVNNYYRESWGGGVAYQQIESRSMRPQYAAFELLRKYLADTNLSILDAGAGTGSGLMPFLEAGFKNIEAIEPSPRRAEQIRKQLPELKVESIGIQSLKDSKILKKKYDAVYMSHVLEHIPNLHDAAKALNQALEMNGVLLIIVPNLENEHLGQLSLGYVHVHSFRDNTLQRLFEMHGFSLVENDSSNGAGLRMIFRKTGTIKNDRSTTLARRLNAEFYNTKVMKDFQLLYLSHQPRESWKRVFLAFHYASTFTGTGLIKYPMSLLDYLFARIWVRASNLRTANPKPLNKLLFKPLYWMNRKYSVPDGGLLCSKIEQIPVTEEMRKLLLTEELLTVKLGYTDARFEFWHQ